MTTLTTAHDRARAIEIGQIYDMSVRWSDHRTIVERVVKRSCCTDGVCITCYRERAVVRDRAKSGNHTQGMLEAQPMKLVTATHSDSSPRLSLRARHW